MRTDLRKAAHALAGVCLASAICLTASPAVAQRTMGFGFCASPYPPRCVSDPATYGSQADTNKCQEEVNRYVNFVGTYRLCLTQETERAVRETNGTLNRWKCSVAAKAPCQ
ncbi:MAG: hypothetical protein WB663_16795 [Beijerinckiaceae bacterium]